MTQSKPSEQCQRVHVEIEPHDAGQRLKIRVESYDDKLGWYTAGSVALPWDQVPLLEQAMEEMRSRQAADPACSSKIIPFPAVCSPSTVLASE
jgi:hypothetical protein